MTEFRELKFGYASAEIEGAYEPKLLLDGYYNQNEIIAEARHGPRFLFLGYKGSGKSAISQHLKLKANQSNDLCVTPLLLADFPYTDFKRIIRGNDALEAKYPTAWSWLLLLNLFASFQKDETSPTHNDLDFYSVIQTLKGLGLLPAPSLRQIVLTTSKRSFEITVPPSLQTHFDRIVDKQSLQIPSFVEHLKSLATIFRSEKQHLLIIDGLDDILTGRQAQYQALAALVFEVSRLNLMFQQSGVPVKIILLCRTDLYERLPGANKNKIRQDSAVQLDWYRDPRNPDESNLIKLINLRARIQDQRIHNVFAQYFPKHIDSQGTETEGFLLDLTRHSPRDFIQLLTHIQKFTGIGKVTRDQILSGVRSYSINYFLPEIKDELIGYVMSDDIELVMDLIGSLRKRDFSYSELETKAKEQNKFSKLDLPEIISALFECSAIGNIQNRPGGTTYYTFRFRNRNSTFNLGDRLILHRGMWKAMNLV